MRVELRSTATDRLWDAELMDGYYEYPGVEIPSTGRVDLKRSVAEALIEAEMAVPVEDEEEPADTVDEREPAVTRSEPDEEPDDDAEPNVETLRESAVAPDEDPDAEMERADEDADADSVMEE